MNGEEEPSMMMEDHEEIDGDNTPLQSPRDDAPTTMVNNVDDKPVQNGDEKVCCILQTGKIQLAE